MEMNIKLKVQKVLVINEKKRDMIEGETENNRKKVINK